MARVTKAVIAAAGFGTRFLPQTKAMPKEMLPIVDKPVIQYIVEQLVEAGIRDIIIVGSSNKRAIEDHFDTPSADLLANLRAGGASKQPFIDNIEAIADLANFAFVRQKGPYGTATPIANAAHLIGDEPFIYTFADDITIASPNMFSQMMSLHEELGGCVLPCIRVKDDIDFERYGMVGGSEVRQDVLKVERIIEKPGRANSPSDFASIGGYLLTPEVFTYLDAGRQALQPGQEFYATDSLLQPMLADGKLVHGLEIKHQGRYDTGNPLDYVKTVLDFALERPDIGPELRKYLKNRL